MKNAMELAKYLESQALSNLGEIGKKRKDIIIENNKLDLKGFILLQVNNYVRQIGKLLKPEEIYTGEEDVSDTVARMIFCDKYNRKIAYVYFKR